MKSSAARECFILVFTALVLGSLACSSVSERAAERYIKESESQWAESVATGDTSVLERILADGLGISGR